MNRCEVRKGDGGRDRCPQETEVMIDYGNSCTIETCRTCAEAIVARDPNIGVIKPLGSTPSRPGYWSDGRPFGSKKPKRVIAMNFTEEEWQAIERRFAKRNAAVKALGARLARCEKAHPSSGLIDPDFIRASGGCVCPGCKLEYRDHPEHPTWEFLQILCDGSLVKL